MQSNSRNHLDALEHMNPSPWKERLRRRFTMRYSRIQAVKARNAKLGDLLEAQVRLEDEAFGQQVRIRAGDRNAEDQLKATAKELANNDLAVRAARVAQLKDTIERLELALKKQTDVLERDKRDPDALTERWLHQYQNKAPSHPRHGRLNSDGAAPREPAGADSADEEIEQ